MTLEHFIHIFYILCDIRRETRKYGRCFLLCSMSPMVLTSVSYNIYSHFLICKVQPMLYSNITDGSMLSCVMLRYWNDDGFNDHGCRVHTVLDRVLCQWAFIPYKAYAPRF